MLNNYLRNLKTPYYTWSQHRLSIVNSAWKRFLIIRVLFHLSVLKSCRYPLFQCAWGRSWVRHWACSGISLPESSRASAKMVETTIEDNEREVGLSKRSRVFQVAFASVPTLPGTMFFPSSVRNLGHSFRKLWLCPSKQPRRGEPALRLELAPALTVPAVAPCKTALKGQTWNKKWRPGEQEISLRRSIISVLTSAIDSNNQNLLYALGKKIFLVFWILPLVRDWQICLVVLQIHHTTAKCQVWFLSVGKKTHKQQHQQHNCKRN